MSFGDFPWQISISSGYRELEQFATVLFPSVILKQKIKGYTVLVCNDRRVPSSWVSFASVVSSYGNSWSIREGFCVDVSHWKEWHGPAVWLLRKVGQVFEGDFFKGRIYFETVAWEISIRLSNSSWIRGAPLRMLIACISRISLRGPTSIAGRPGLGLRFFKRQ